MVLGPRPSTEAPGLTARGNSMVVTTFIIGAQAGGQDLARSGPATCYPAIGPNAGITGEPPMMMEVRYQPGCCQNRHVDMTRSFNHIGWCAGSRHGCSTPRDECGEDRSGSNSDLRADSDQVRYRVDFRHSQTPMHWSVECQQAISAFRCKRVACETDLRHVFRGGRNTHGGSWVRGDDSGREYRTKCTGR